VLDDGDGFREGLYPSYYLVPDGLFDCLTGKTLNFLSSPLRKNISVLVPPKSLHIPHRLVPLEGRIAIVTDAGRDAVDVGGAFDESAGFADGEVVWS
jgi:hypothetical protein